MDKKNLRGQIHNAMYQNIMKKAGLLQLMFLWMLEFCQSSTMKIGDLAEFPLWKRSASVIYVS